MKNEEWASETQRAVQQNALTTRCRRRRRRSNQKNDQMYVKLCVIDIHIRRRRRRRRSTVPYVRETHSVRTSVQLQSIAVLTGNANVKQIYRRWCLVVYSNAPPTNIVNIFRGGETIKNCFMKSACGAWKLLNASRNCSHYEPIQFVMCAFQPEWATVKHDYYYVPICSWEKK